MRRTLLACALALPALASCRSGGDASADAAADASAPALTALREIPSPAAPGSAEPNLAAGDDGRVYLSWVEPAPDSAHALRFAVLEGGRWSAPRTVASGRDWFVNWADFPSLAVLPGGRLAAHWLQRSGPGRYAYDVRIARSTDGGATWSPGVVPHRDGVPAEHGFVSLWPAEGDSLGAVWLDGRKYAAAEGGEGEHGGETMLVHTALAADGGVGAERPLDARICDCCQTGQATTSAGPLVVYRDRSADEIRDVYVVRRVGGRWTEPRPVHADGWKIPACPVNGPQVAARGEQVAVAWFTGARDTARVLVAFSRDAGATFGAPVRVDDGDPAGRVDVELLEGGGALVSWI
ncbi:MAG TPA: sialidase family protein, partial [Longimicrobiaceae bacterium]|nr:sialidase family protein [Longimicrobiaceae bacterium]